jgi:multisubunit Na+/H+ antiporter MnhG subunit
MSEQPPSIGRTYAKYLGLRLLLFGVALAICIVAGLSGILAVIIALLVSGIVAYPLARRQRDDVARAFQQRRRRR